MTKTGNYIIRYYNKYGTRLKDISDVSESLTTANEIAVDRLKMPKTSDSSYKPVSYTIDRRIFNSLDAC